MATPPRKPGQYDDDDRQHQFPERRDQPWPSDSEPLSTEVDPIYRVPIDQGVPPAKPPDDEVLT